MISRAGKTVEGASSTDGASWVCKGVGLEEDHHSTRSGTALWRTQP